MLHRKNGIGIALSVAGREDLQFSTSEGGCFEVTTPHRRVSVLICNDRQHHVDYTLYCGEEIISTGSIQGLERRTLPKTVDYPTGETKMVIRVDLSLEGSIIQSFTVDCTSTEHRQVSVQEQEELTWSAREALDHAWPAYRGPQPIQVAD